ncbi:hypothetical protein [Pseudoalteromonas luteoviolacea]|uniref:hypothetical protein n=1 Tax=Pseudoalteromonas luteoviolacea TaxID=43657 RepID=UPI001146D896|nr:hypothetical protein [Pseudoalteromonas luteoviolacea]
MLFIININEYLGLTMCDLGIWNKKVGEPTLGWLANTKRQAQLHKVESDIMPIIGETTISTYLRQRVTSDFVRL